MEYINVENALRFIKIAKFDTQNDKDLVLEIISTVVPREDVVSIVHCKDCDVLHNKFIGCYHLNGLVPPSDFYCPYGKKKRK